ncbi:uncharacterized protein LOC133193562 [Saccostrea echinata]|uniref:uncharacterized protein LOC133193562 n=1 Tax=Saccostrea echinata TaxID=191078 RepID=UPI002A80F635|nr:uncharacterized protein LOC133193562 [Saccostrea echinata]
MATFDKGKRIIQELRKRIRDTRMEATETASRRSASSRTASSHVDSILFKKRVEAETQRANILFREKELAILKEKASLKEYEAKQHAESERKKAELEATHHLLGEKRKATLVEAEVKAIENFESDSRQGSVIPSDIDAPKNRKQYTARYISEHSDNSIDRY